MGSYVLYKSMTEMLTRTYRKVNKLPKKNLKNLGDFVLRTMYDQFPQMLQTMDNIILFDEYCQKEYGNNIIFPETKSLVAFLYKSKFSVTKDSFKTPYPYQVICFPSNMTIDGIQIHSCLFSYTKHKDRKTMFPEFNKKFFPSYTVDFCKEPHPKAAGREFTEDPEGDISDYTLNLCYPSSMGGQKSYIKCTVPSFMLQDALKGPKQLMETIGDYYSYKKSYSLDDEEVKSQYATLKVCCALCIYIIAHPEALISGLPNHETTRSKRFFGKPRGYIIKTPDKIKTSPSMHYRNGHFRELRHEKFKRNPDGSIRIIEVSDAIIGNKEVNAKTVVENLKNRRQKV